MKMKTYDKKTLRELAELICEGTMTNKEIGKRLGMSASLVDRIANGRLHPKLLPLISQLSRKNLRTARREIRRLTKALAAARSTRPGRAKRIAPKFKDYDDDRLIALLGEGLHTYKEIADQVGISETMVGNIARGEIRPHLLDRISKVHRGHLRKTRGRGAARLYTVLDKHMDSGQGDDESARKCREFVLNKYLDMPCDEPPAPADESPFENFAKLTPLTQARVAHDLGGPEPDPRGLQDAPQDRQGDGEEGTGV